MKKTLTLAPIRNSRKGFTIVELLVVVSIIALLIGILLPAIGKAREQAQLTRSQSNIKQIGTSIVAYAAEFGDRQPTFINDHISTYGPLTGGPGNAGTAFNNFQIKHGGESHPWLWLGWQNLGGVGGQAQLIGWGAGPPAAIGDWQLYALHPIHFWAPQKGFGAFRFPNARAINQFMNGRFYDEIYYAPKDSAVIDAVDKWLGIPAEFINVDATHKWSSYIMSPAAMYNPIVFSKTASNTYYTDPWTLPSGFKSPGLSQAQYGNLKTHVIEHHWLQGRKKECIPNVNNQAYNGCSPYYFNAAFNSSPVTLFYDGHVGQVGVEDSMTSDGMVDVASPGAGGLWSRQTPFGNAPDGGYFMNNAYDFSATSFHILTIDGIKGRDITSK